MSDTDMTPFCPAPPRFGWTEKQKQEQKIREEQEMNIGHDQEKKRLEDEDKVRQEQQVKNPEKKKNSSSQKKDKPVRGASKDKQDKKIEEQPVRGSSKRKRIMSEATVVLEKMNMLVIDERTKFAERAVLIKEYHEQKGLCAKGVHSASMIASEGIKIAADAIKNVQKESNKLEEIMKEGVTFSNMEAFTAAMAKVEEAEVACDKALYNDHQNWVALANWSNKMVLVSKPLLGENN